MPPHSTKFRTEWIAEFPFISAVEGDNTKGNCRLCLSVFSISHGGTSDIKYHTKSQRHQNGKQNLAIHHKIPDLFKKHLSKSHHQLKPVLGIGIGIVFFVFSNDSKSNKTTC